MAITGVEQITMDFIRDDDQVMPEAGFGQSLQFLQGKYPSHGVVRIAEDKDPRSVSNGLLELIEVDFVGIAFLN